MMGPNIFTAVSIILTKRMILRAGMYLNQLRPSFRLQKF